MKKVVCFFCVVLFLIPVSVYAQRGCCSHHGGVSGSCSTSGKQICNDGTESPSCTCVSYDEVDTSDSYVENTSYDYDADTEYSDTNDDIDYDSNDDIEANYLTGEEETETDDENGSSGAWLWLFAIGGLIGYAAIKH